MSGASYKITKVDLFWLRVISPLSWPVWLRRLFLLTIPVSVPAYLALLVVLVFALLIVRLSEPIGEFWNSPQRKVRMNMYDYYRMGVDKKRRATDKQDDEEPIA